MKLNFPTAHTILLLIAGFAALLTFLVPSGKYEKLAFEDGKFIHTTTSETKEYEATQEVLDRLGIKSPLEKFTSGDIYKPVGIPNTYTKVESNPQGLMAWLASPLRGIKDSMDIILFVLILGGCIGIVQASGAFDSGVAWLAKNLKGREKWLIFLILTLIALGGTTFGLAEETIAFYPILVPVFLAAGYDAMVALATIYIGTSVGTMVSTTNPFSTIIASNTAGIEWSSGLNGRIAMWTICVGICIWYVLRYAEKVRKNPEKSLIFKQKATIEAAFLKNKGQTVPPLDFRKKLILLLFFLCFVVMIAGVSIEHWYFEEMTLIFFIGALLLGIVSGMGEKSVVTNFVKGANDLLSVALIIGIARGVSILLEEGLVSDTLLHSASQAVEGMPKPLFITVMFFVFAGLSFFIPSSSGLAVLSMPIMAPLADVVGAPRESVINAYQFGMGILAFITPTGLILPSLAMVDVTFDKWLKFVMPLLGMLAVVLLAALVIGVV